MHSVHGFHRNPRFWSTILFTTEFSGKVVLLVAVFIKGDTIFNEIVLLIREGKND